MLNSLEIKNFRILEDFRVSKLGRVNLIVGKNNSGKSSVLEALRIYAGNAQRELLEQIAADHDEIYRLRENEQFDSDIQFPFEDLFIGRQFPQDETLAISIGELALGDDALQIELQLVLKIFPAKGGFLLIDEFENGLHFSIQEKVWELLFEMAQKLDIQIFATTHSWDCIESFVNTAIARKDVEGVLFRVGRSVRKSDRGQVIATVFDEDALYNITQADVEVR
jgi:AAA15 family ATPase/GTPase